MQQKSMKTKQSKSSRLLTFHSEYEVLATSTVLIYRHAHVLASVFRGHVVHRQALSAAIFDNLEVLRILELFNLLQDTIPEDVWTKYDLAHLTFYHLDTYFHAFVVPYRKLYFIEDISY